MPESLPIALALVALAVAGWDCARRYMQLAHGRMLSADRSQTFERAITTLDTRVKQLSDAYDTLQDVVLTGRKRIDELQAEKADAATFASINDLSVVIEDMKLLDKRVTAHDRSLADYGHALSQDAQRFAGLTDWQKTCERSIELLQADIDKRDKAITNVAEEVAGLQRQQALALMGIAKTPKHGYAPGGTK